MLKRVAETRFFPNAALVFFLSGSTQEPAESFVHKPQDYPATRGCALRRPQTRQIRRFQRVARRSGHPSPRALASRTINRRWRNVSISYRSKSGFCKMTRPRELEGTEILFSP